MQLPFTLAHTGHGSTTTFVHQIHTSLDGRPFPVVAAVHKGYATSRFKWQAIPCGAPYARIWAEGSANPNVGWESGFEFYDANGELAAETLSEAAKLWLLDVEALDALLQEVEGWQNGRGCRWSPGCQGVEAADFGLWRMASTLPNPRRASQFLAALWGLFSPNAEWYARVGEGLRIDQRGMTVAPGLRGRWRNHRAPILSEPLQSSEVIVAHHRIAFSDPIWLLASDTDDGQGPEEGFWKAVGWARRPTSVAVYDLRLEEQQGTELLGLFWLRHWPRDGLD